jgi:hypothetical protein
VTDADAAGMLDEQVIEYVEASFQLVAKPTESWFHDYCRSSHPTKFDTAAGRYDYTVSVNALLDALAPAYGCRTARSARRAVK